MGDEHVDGGQDEEREKRADDHPGDEDDADAVARAGAGAAGWVAVLISWGVFFTGWIAAGLLTPSGTDNTPIRTHGPLDIEHELVEV